MPDLLLKVSGVSVTIPTGQGTVHAVDDATFSINKHEIFSLWPLWGYSVHHHLFLARQ